MPALYYPACVFYGIILDDPEIIHLLRRYKRFKPDEWERENANFDENEWYVSYLNDTCYEFINDLEEEFAKEGNKVSIDCFHPEYGEPSCCLSIPGTYKYFDISNPDGHINVGDFKEWDERFKDIYTKYGIGGTEPRYHFLKSEDYRFGAIFCYGIWIHYDEMMHILMEHRDLFDEKKQQILDYGSNFFDSRDDLSEDVESAWAKEADPIQVVRIRERENDDNYYLAIRDTYNYFEDPTAYLSFELQSTKTWDLLLKEKCDEYGIIYSKPVFHLLLSLPIND
ncbi:MAG: hypothetical protein ACFFD2_13665 [Promethearchaeota archaeon]